MIVPRLKEILHWVGVLHPFYGYNKAFFLSFCHGFWVQPANLKTFWKFLAQKHKSTFSIAKVENVIKQGLVSNKS